VIDRERAYAAAEKLLRSNGINESARVVRNSLKANRDDYLGFIEAGRPVDARRAEEAMFRDREVLLVLRDWKEG